MRRGTLAVTLAGMLAVSGPACSGSQGPEFGRADADAIRQATQDFTAAYNAKDAAKVVTHFSATAVLMPPNSSPLRGANSIRGYYEIRFGQGATDLNIEPKDVGGFGTLAYVSGTYRLRVQPPDGGPETRDRGKFLWIVREFGGRWRYEYQMWSSDLPPPPQAK